MMNFIALLRAKQSAKEALENETPTFSRQYYERLIANNQNKRTEKYRSKKKTAIKRWTIGNDYAYSELVRSCEDNSAAINLIMANTDQTAKQIMAAIEAKFNLADVPTVVPAKFEELNGMLLHDNEECSDFIEGINAAKITLNGMGLDYVYDDIFCLGISETEFNTTIAIRLWL